MHGAVLTAVGAWRGELPPGQDRDARGELHIGGIPATELAAQYGTPLLVIDLDVVDAAIDSILAAASAHGVEVSYAGKAFATTEFLRHISRHDLGVDVCSLGELVTAERAGFAPGRITLHGAGKSNEELTAACAGRIGLIAVDGLEELQRLIELSREGCAAGVLLRLNVGIEAGIHAYVRTGGDDTKFGIAVQDEATAAQLLKANPQLRFAGVHAHLGSQIYEGSTYAANASALVEAAKRFESLGLSGERVVIGGGYGVPSHPDAVPEALAVATAIAQAARAAEGKRLGIEPGRAIVALAGTTLYTVMAVKRQSQRTFVVVDGGLMENPRPALYGARHHVVAASPSQGGFEDMTLCGRSCENDELGNVRLPADVRGGALLAMCSTGAYTYSMAGNYNRVPRPAVAGIAKGRPRLLARRETVEDVLRSDEVE